MLKLFSSFITCISCVTRVFHCVRSQKEPTGFLISRFYMLVAEHITFDVYLGIVAVHGFLMAADSSDCLLFVSYK